MLPSYQDMTHMPSLFIQSRHRTRRRKPTSFSEQSMNDFYGAIEHHMVSVSYHLSFVALQRCSFEENNRLG
jgi:hypothetical protein